MHTNATSPDSSKPVAVLCGDLNMLRCFVGTDIQTCVVTSDPDEVTLYSRHCKDNWVIASPAREPDRALGHLEALGQTYERPAVLYYGDDAMLRLVSRERDRLSRSFRFLLPSAERIAELTDKSRFVDLARALRLPVPRSYTSQELDSAEAVLRTLGVPCILKPSSHVGWFASQVGSGQRIPQKALRVDSAEELRASYDRLKGFTDDFVIQQFVGGGGDQIYSFHTFYTAEHQPLAWFVGRKIRTYPKHAGVSTYLELVDEPEIVRLGRQVADALELVGPAKLDFKRDVDGTFYLLEVNARYTLWNHLGAAAGVNIPLLAYDYLRSERPAQPAPPRTEYQVGMKWLNFGNDARAVMRDYRPRGDLSLVSWLRSYRGPKVYDIFAWDDPVPAVMSYGKYLRALGRRLGSRLTARPAG